MAEFQHKIAADLHAYARKVAAEKAAAGEGAPDRMTAGDGDGGVQVSKGTIPKDVGEEEVKRDQPADGKIRTAAAIPGTSPDRMTAGDGDGGVQVSKGTIPKDVGEEEVKRDQPADGETRKAATLSKRAAGLRAALAQASPTLAKRLAEPTQESTQKQAAGNSDKEEPRSTLNVDQETLAKIASAVLSTDQGTRFVYDTLEKQAGEAAARAQIQEALQAAKSYDEGEIVKSAAIDDLREKAEVIYSALDSNGITEEDADEILKQAAFHHERIDSLAHPMLKAAYAQGMDDAALLTAADEAAGQEGVPGVDEALPMGGEDLGEEEILQLLEEMLASGEITEEDIQAALAGEGAGDMGAEGAEGAAAAEAAPQLMV